MNTAESLRGYDLEWRDDIRGTAVGDGDNVDVGGATLSIIATPGHSHCSLSAYEPGLKALFASDSAGIPFKETFFPSMNTNPDQFLESLEKVKTLPVSYFCADHYGYITGEEASQCVPRTIEEGRKWKAYLEDHYRRHGGDIESAGKEITDFFYDEMPGYFLSRDILEMVFKQMLKYIAKTQG